jgi:hypothetical protein
VTPTILGAVTKAPADAVDVAVAWTLPTGDSIASVEWTATGGIEVGAGAIAPSVAGQVTTAFAVGGESGDAGLLVVKLTTAEGRIATRGVRVNVREVA